MPGGATRRRDFIHLASSNVAWLGLGTLGMDALRLTPELKPVTLHAEIGNLFPPLELVDRMCKSGHSSAQLLVVNMSSEHELPGARRSQTIHAGVRMTELDPRVHQGNLHRSTQEAVMRRIKIVLKERLQYEVVKITIDPGPAFWYPYLGTIVGCLVFCRLEVTDSLPGEAN
jgi:hypothetical protein